MKRSEATEDEVGGKPSIYSSSVQHGPDLGAEEIQQAPFPHEGRCSQKKTVPQELGRNRVHRMDKHLKEVSWGLKK